jgi:glyoxylase-like metal-dependent hydrolase (beta-lactamase superfamily II)
MSDAKTQHPDNESKSTNRRGFLKTAAGALAGISAVGLIPGISEAVSRSRFPGISNETKAAPCEVYALKYGEMQSMPNSLWYWLGNPALAPRQEISTKGAFYWLIKGPAGNILFDAGTTPETAKTHHIDNYEDHATVLAKMDMKIEDIDAVIISHAHFDHINGCRVFQDKTTSFYIQETCFRWAVEEYPSYPLFRSMGIPALEDIEWLTRELYSGRLNLVQGKRGGKAVNIFPGVSVRRVDGHMMGLQIAMVKTAKGPVVLTSDISYLYDNLDMNWPVGLIMGSLTDAMEGLDVCRESGKIMVPGHDMKITEKYPEVKPGVFRIA